MKYLSRGQYTVKTPLLDLDPYDVYYISAEIRQKIRKHDIAIVRVRTSRMQWFEFFYSGAPIKVDYMDEDGNKATFVGYVTHVKPSFTGEDNGYYERDVVCVAASREMRRTARHTYRNKTAPEIVNEIGRELRFNVVTQQHSLRRPTVVHSGETYWEFLAALAKRTGYVLRVEGTTIFFLSLPQMVKAYRSRAPYLTDYGYAENMGQDKPNVHTVESWVGDSSDDDDDLSDSSTYVAVHPVSGEVFEATERPGSAISRKRASRSGYVRYPHGVAAHSREDARLLAKGAADNGMMAFDTTMTVAGNTLLQPYHPVVVDLKDRPLNGVMVVKEVTHVLSKGRYHCDLVVSTDSVDGVERHAAGRGRPAHRDINAELEQGIVPDLVAKSRLSVVATSPSDTPMGKWLAR